MEARSVTSSIQLHCLKPIVSVLFLFRRSVFSRSAFLHPTHPYMWENMPHYQRLEFLGDALLDMVFINHLFYRHPDKDPQWLTEAKTVMVSNRFLGMLACELGFYKHLRHNSTAIGGQIREYLVELEESKATANGSVDYWMSIIEPPKCLADIVEAYVAAMFIDSNFDFGEVQKFFDQPWVQHGDPEVLFIKRASRPGDRWTGHVALPGGKRDPEDVDDRAAAIREADEEIGWDLTTDDCISVGNLPERVVTTSWGSVPYVLPGGGDYQVKIHSC